MIKNLRIRNFKCYGETGMEISLARVNFLFGDNSSGKSSFMQFLHIIKETVCNPETKALVSALWVDKYVSKIGAQNDWPSCKISGEVTVSKENAVEEKWNFGCHKVNNRDAYLLLDESQNLVSERDFGNVMYVYAIAGKEKAKEISSEEFLKLLNSPSRPDCAVEKIEEREISHGWRIAPYINDFLRRSGVEYKIVSSSDGTISHWLVHDNIFDVDVDIDEVGTGVRGLFNLAYVFASWDHGILCVEEPESNVNERHIGLLTRTMVEEAMKKTNGQLMVECHSELTALTIKNLVREGIMKPEDVTIHFAEKTPDGTILHRIHIDENGNFLDKWPNGGFFAERAKIIDEFYNIKK